MSASNPFPTYTDLPLKKDGPHGNAWGAWGPDDQIGTLNHLTPEIVARAAREEIRIGERVSLNWSLAGPVHPTLGRKGLDVKVINKEPIKVAHDEELSFNSQISSQWDGFRHYGYQKEKLYFMGHTANEFENSTVNGIQSAYYVGFHAFRGFASGRAILIDWYKWALQHHRETEIDAFTAYGIPFSSLMQATKDQSGLTPNDFRPGDILFVRSGYIHQYETMPQSKRDLLQKRYKTTKPENIGVVPSEDLLRFLWDKKVAAVAGDARSFEVWPCSEPEWHLHEWLLAGWGMPIGELFDLEELSRICERLGRYTFFLSSEPLNVPGGIASPPNALAFF